MSKKITILLIGGSLFAAVVSLMVYIAKDNKLARQAQLDKNLREAGFGGAPDLAHAPSIEISNPTFDVGVVNPLDAVSRVIAVQNQGHKPLKVRVLDQACSCLAVTIKDEKIYPGQSGVIEVTFTAPQEEKQVNHSVLLSTNDPLQKQVAISVTGSVQRTVWTEPRELNFTALLPKEVRRRELRVFSTWEEGCEVTRMSGLPAGVEFATRPLAHDELEAAGARSGQLCTITFPASWTGSASAPLTFDAARTGSSEFVRKSVQLNAKRLGRVSLSHDRLDVFGSFEIGNIPYGAGREYTLFLEARGANKQLQLVRVEAQPEFLKASMEPGVNVATSGRHFLKLEIPPDAPEGSYAGDDRGSVTLHFDDPEYPAVTFHPMFHITRD